MFCNSCGAKMPDGMRFCTQCGSPLALAEEKPGAAKAIAGAGLAAGKAAFGAIRKGVQAVDHTLNPEKALEPLASWFLDIKDDFHFGLCNSSGKCEYQVRCSCSLFNESVKIKDLERGITWVHSGLIGRKISSKAGMIDLKGNSGTYYDFEPFGWSITAKNSIMGGWRFVVNDKHHNPVACLHDDVVDVYREGTPREVLIALLFLWGDNAISARISKTSC